MFLPFLDKQADDEKQDDYPKQGSYRRLGRKGIQVYLLPAYCSGVDRLYIGKQQDKQQEMPICLYFMDDTSHVISERTMYEKQPYNSLGLFFMTYFLVFLFWE